MQFIQRTAIAISLVVSASVPSIGAETAEPPKYPDSGTYFIVNAQSEQALQPVGASAGQNVYMAEFTKGGAQKWTITRKIDPVTKKPTNRYTIRLAGDNQGLNFQPHPSVDGSAIISTDTSVFVLDPGEAGYLVKSVSKNGDALFIYPSPPSETETRFGPNDGSAKFRWKFIPAS